MFNLAVFHHESLYLVHVGPTHSYVMTRDHVQEFSDLYTAGKGLGSAVRSICAIIRSRFSRATYYCCLLTLRLAGRRLP